MRVAPSAPAFLADPIGAYLDATAFVVWAQSPTRIGLFHTAPFMDHADRQKILTIAPLAAHVALGPRYDALHDLAAVVTIDEASFEFVERFLREHALAIAARASKVAVVRPEGYAGAAFTGLFERWVRPHFDTRLCATRTAAYDFLAVPEPDRRALDALGTGRGEPLRRLREALATDLIDATVDRLAARLGTSPRSLQRQMSAHGTSFRAELERARIRAVETRLIETDDKLDAIAGEVGIASASALVRLFERATGVAPGEFRKRAHERHGRSGDW